MNDAGATGGEEGTMRRINTVPVDLVARALLPASSLDDTAMSRRRRGDAYICANCRRCDSAIEGTSSTSARRTAHGVDSASCPVGSAASGQSATGNAGVHAPRKFASQAIFQLPYS